MKKLLLSLLLILTITDVYAATLYIGSGETYTTLQSAMSAMESGDTLIIRDGTYTGTSNTIDSTHYPPNGSDGAYTTIQAENTGSVIFDGEYTNQMFDLTVAGASYLVFDGIEWCKTPDGAGSIVNISNATNPHHIKFLRCGAYNSGSFDAETDYRDDVFSINNAHHILLENCYVYGNFRYGVYFGQNTQYAIARQCVVRIDSGNSETGMAGFITYDAQDVLLQNCITIDSDNDQGYYKALGLGDKYASFYTRHVAGLDMTGIAYTGCIAVNQTRGLSFLNSSGASSNVIISNCIGWDTEGGAKDRAGVMVYDNCTFGVISGGTSTDNHTIYQESGDGAVTDTILYGNENEEAARGDGSYTAGDYNCFYGNAIANYLNWTPGANDITSTNPLTNSLLYLLRIESGSDLAGSGSEGGQIGATILKQIGTSGTLYGDTGYNTTTETDLWPFLNEDVIKAKMAAYEYDDGSGGDPEITGARGFCATGKQLNGTDDITLTSYIWEYLGNEMPADIYGAATEPVLTINQTSQTVYTDSISITGSETHESGRTITSLAWSNDHGGSGSLTVNAGVISGTVTGLSSGANVITFTLTDSSAETDVIQYTYTYSVPTPSGATVLGAVIIGGYAG